MFSWYQQRYKGLELHLSLVDISYHGLWILFTLVVHVLCNDCQFGIDCIVIQDSINALHGLFRIMKFQDLNWWSIFWLLRRSLITYWEFIVGIPQPVVLLFSFIAWGLSGFSENCIYKKVFQSCSSTYDILLFMRNLECCLFCLVSSLLV